MSTYKKTERGQAIVVVAVIIVVLLGLTALAIDGGMIYTDRRNAQNAADSAALAGALETSIAYNQTKIHTTIDTSISANGYDPLNTSKSIEHFNNPGDIEGEYYLITVVLTDTTNTYFAQMFVGDEMKTVVTATAKVRVSQPVFPGVAIVALGNCTDGDVTFDVGMNGGGNDDMQVNFGGIFVNSDGSGSCAIEPPTAENSGLLIDPYDIWSVGSDDFSSLDPDHITWGDTHTGYNGGMPVSDPLYDLADPECSGPGAGMVGGQYQPGEYDTIPAGPLAPGIYCIANDTHFSGDEEFTSPSGGVLLYLHGGLDFTGNSGMNLIGPNSSTCPGSGYTPYDACFFSGMAIFGARDNTSEIELAGNGDVTVDGLLYAPAATIVVSGGGSDPHDITVNGQIIAQGVQSNGGANFIVNYNAGNTLQAPVRISLVK